MIKKHVSLYLSFFKASLMSDLEYRLNILTKVFTDIIWYAAQASIFEVLFHHTNQIASWNLNQARVFSAVLFLVDALWMIIFHENFDRLSMKVRRGDLDLVLAKPVNAQFMISLQKQNTSYLVNVIVTILYLSFTVSLLNEPVSALNIGLFVFVGVPSALMIIYSFRLFFAVLSVIFTNAEAVNYVFYQIYRLGMRPDGFYPQWMRYILLSFLPMAFVASVPARMLLNQANLLLIGAAPLISLISVLVISTFWRYSLRHYASASS